MKTANILLFNRKPRSHFAYKSRELGEAVNWWIALFRDRVANQNAWKTLPTALLPVTNRFHVACVFLSNRFHGYRASRSQIHQNVVRVAHEAIVTNVLTTFWSWRPLWSITEQTNGNMESFCFIWKDKAFWFRNSKQLESRPLPTLPFTKKKQFFIIYGLYKMKQSHWLLCVANKSDCSRKITPHCQTANKYENGLMLIFWAEVRIPGSSRLLTDFVEEIHSLNSQIQI